MDRSKEFEEQGDFKNAFPWEVQRRPDDDSETPRPLHTQADREPPLSRPEADVLGISPTPEVVYGESSEHENDEDERDAHHAAPDEHL
jgi:hypothetical protein